jgi:formate hydrogenlyase subunit 3/multisubunit Na+/H+ antiporter MnhD subunit
MTRIKIDQNASDNQGGIWKGFSTGIDILSIGALFVTLNIIFFIVCLAYSLRKKDKKYIYHALSSMILIYGSLLLVKIFSK